MLLLHLHCHLLNPLVCICKLQRRWLLVTLHQIPHTTAFNSACGQSRALL